MLKHFENLCGINGGSGMENDVRGYILEVIGGNCECSTDNLGNITALKKGRKQGGKKLLIAAHMDEVSLIITSVRDDGTLSFGTVGAINPEALLGRQIIAGSVNGVIGSKAVHNLSPAERQKAVTADDIYIDIGAKNKETALKYIRPGDYAYFPPNYKIFGEDENPRIMSKALDDRAGCAVLLNLIEENFDHDIYFVFTTQEEIGLRGARTAAFSINPDYALVIDATTAADMPGVADEKRVCLLGKGAVVPFMDKGTIYNKELYNMAFSVAHDKCIQIQTKTQIAGANDSGAINISGKGVKTLSVSVPCRYLHSGCCVIDIKDLEACKSLTEEMIKAIAEI